MLKNRCKHFGMCGGCSLQDKTYIEQVSLKRSFLCDSLSESGLVVKDISFTEANQSYHYRNKMEFTFSEDFGNNSLGLHRKNSSQVIDLEECFLFIEDLNIILNLFREMAEDLNLSFYNKYKRQGFLRNLVLRTSENHEFMMVNLVTTSQSELENRFLIDKLLSLNLKCRIVSIIRTTNDSFSDAVICEDSKVIYGDGFLNQDINGVKYQISAFSFFQVNIDMLKLYYRFVEDYLDFSKEGNILDLFCGIGGMGLFLSQRVNKVIGVDIIDKELADTNAKINNFSNITFIQRDVRKALYENLSDWEGKFDFVFINPPRGGLAKKVIKRVIEIGAGTVIYSSCNLATLISDLKQFIQDYRIELVNSFDFFPQTLHMETLVVLRKN